jgi:transposase
MHVDHKPGDTMQVDWAGQTGGIIDTDTGKIIPVYLFVAVLPYSGYAYTEGFLDMKQEAWINAHVHAYQYFGGITRLLVPDNLKTGVVKNNKDETVINKTYQEKGLPSTLMITKLKKMEQHGLRFARIAGSVIAPYWKIEQE